ncbi:TetR/AcrR family transcriptional regulator [[Mycobacterium] nativiensis]|uniref:TetR family transcriptional regulator n=1 Tax=[Mycobacterium] nativiensis TaxID=2855503 RepID=A0ABU5XQ52_9MYCO|nr:TetR family transcriptional regulator [Mycolicibacter sp. MYC340]MEB3030043.1 TetR family transcriptional regulator [Mycolicibacter sp. MYC340]
MVILDAAAHAFSTKGLAGTRLTDVVEYLQIPLSAIYPYFPSREHLIEEVMYRGISEMHSHLQKTLEALPSGVAPLDRLMAAVEAHLRQVLEFSDYCSAWIRNAGQVPGGISTRQKKLEATYGRIWRTLFDDAIGDRETPPGFDVRIARMLMLGAMNWAAEWWDPHRGSIDTLVATTQFLVQSGVESATGSSAGNRRQP